MNSISVIMPTYNAAAWVAQAVRSLKAQTYADFELIVVDDGSRDETVGLVREQLARSFDRPWQVIELGSNKGPSAARNCGLRAASGAWVQYLDSDDFISETKFELQMAVCAHASPDMVAVYSPFRMCHVDDGTISWVGPLVDVDMDGRHPLMCLIGGFRPVLGSGLVRRSVLDRIGGFNEALRFWECEEINLRIAKAGRMQRVPSSEPTYLWRMPRGQAYIGGAAARYRSAPVALGWMELVLAACEGHTLDRLGLSDAELKALRDDRTQWGRLLYCSDRGAFRQFLDMAHALEPEAAPTYPKYVAAASGYLGYEGAERFAQLARAPKALARKALAGLKVYNRDALLEFE